MAFPSLSHQLTPPTLTAHPGGAWSWLNSHGVCFWGGQWWMDGKPAFLLPS